MYSNWCICSRTHLYIAIPENLKLWKVSREGVFARGVSLPSPMIGWYWHAGTLHFKHKCLITPGISELAAGTGLGQPLSTGKVAASGFQDCWQAGFLLCQCPSQCF